MYTGLPLSSSVEAALPPTAPSPASWSRMRRQRAPSGQLEVLLVNTTQPPAVSWQDPRGQEWHQSFSGQPEHHSSRLKQAGPNQGWDQRRISSIPPRLGCFPAWRVMPSSFEFFWTYTNERCECFTRRPISTVMNERSWSES